MNIKSNTDIKPEGYHFNELLCQIASEYAAKFGFSLKYDRIWKEQNGRVLLYEMGNKPLREIKYEKIITEGEKSAPSTEVRQRFGNLRISIYYPKENPNDKEVFVSLEFNSNGKFSEAQIFSEEGMRHAPGLLDEIEERWKSWMNDCKP